MLWILFLFLTVVIFLSGKNLVKYGDILAEKLNLGRTIVGIVFVASITSLPELITGISAVTYADSPDIAAGDIFGSCMFNLLILALLDGFVRGKPITTKVHHGLTLSASFGIILITVSAMSIFLRDKIPVLGWVSYSSFFIIALYMLAIWIITNYEKRFLISNIEKAAEELEYSHISLKETAVKYSINAVIIVFAAALLPKVGKEIAHQHGMTETFFGTFFMALSTSLPEVSVSIAAIKMNMVTISVANLLGSNIFNILILAIDDFFYTKGSLFALMDVDNLFSAGIATIMTAIVIIGLIYRAEKKMFILAYESVALIGAYLLGVIILYVL
ncbi:sodium:calcium antiporter [Persephonella atlantica]|uniref:Sodium:calcium antiporter n=1 Tax=Persephonella atlantica TaxID=2699429 RepID=A0ABS1GFX2_9AQUI|nr:sodium:calcium antiporter [Persephonella atlantica]MBK3331766.1 sodium:calcium antiporter [Persephonella atlantica]